MSGYSGIYRFPDYEYDKNRNFILKDQEALYLLNKDYEKIKIIDSKYKERPTHQTIFIEEVEQDIPNKL